MGKKNEEKEKKRKFIVMPIPVSNPTIGTGLGLSAMYLYKVDDASPTSNTMIGGFYTNSDSWVIGGKQTTYLKADKYRFNALLGYMNLNIDFYGIGSDAGDRGGSIPITQKGVFFMPDLLRRFFYKAVFLEI